MTAKAVGLFASRVLTPGLRPDPQGILLGEKALVLFQSIDRLVTFLRIWGEDAGYEDDVPKIEINVLETKLRTREFALNLPIDAAAELDRVRNQASLLGGQAFTGTAKYFVRCRDSQGPYGYDATSLEHDGDVSIYDLDHRQAYRIDRHVNLLDLYLGLEITPTPKPAVTGFTDPIEQASYCVLAPVSITDSLLRLVPGSAPAKVAALDIGGELMVLLMLPNTRRSFVLLCGAIPGLSVFKITVAPTTSPGCIAVELGHTHPLNLKGLKALVAPNEWVLFRRKDHTGQAARGHGAIRFTAPDFTEVQLAIPKTRTIQTDAATAAKKRESRSDAWSLTLRCVPDPNSALHRVNGLRIERKDTALLNEILFRMPTRWLSSVLCAVSNDAIYLISDSVTVDLPFGEYFYLYGEGLYVPFGMVLSPAFTAAQVATLLHRNASPNTLLFFREGLVEATSKAQFGPLERGLLGHIDSVVVPIESLALPADENDSTVEYSR